jgi:predicted signal transduction protein with EAL and GGDEF domain
MSITRTFVSDSLADSSLGFSSGCAAKLATETDKLKSKVKIFFMGWFLLIHLNCHASHEETKQHLSLFYMQLIVYRCRRMATIDFKAIGQGSWI